ncbi:MAG: exodeoxyribonuclease VII large subunit, partial [Myxococcota bacterium]
QVLARLTRRRLASERATLTRLSTRLAKHDPRAQLGRDRRALEGELTRLAAAMRRSVGTRQQRLGSLAARLDAMSPVKVLGRGYAIALGERTGKALTSAAEVDVGERVHVRLARGTLAARVEERNLPEDEE